MCMQCYASVPRYSTQCLQWLEQVRKMTANSMRLDILPNDVLLIIFDYCDEHDLLRLSEVCSRFYDLVRTDMPWVKKRKQFLVTNQMSERFRERCNKILPPRSTCFVSRKWQYGIYRKELVFTQRTKLMPWLRLTNDILWWCGGNELLGFGRKGTTIDSTYGNYHYTGEIYTGGDICKFVPWKDFVICGYTNGAISYFLKYGENKCRIVKLLLSNDSSVNAIDATSENVIAGLDSGTIKIQRHPDMDTSESNVYNVSKTCVNLRAKVRSLSVDPTGVKFAVGSSGTTRDIPPLHVIDIESHTKIDTMRHKWRHGAGILDMVWDDPNTLLTCGYDTYIRKWDLRTERCVSSWADPTDASLYCISSDHRYTMVTGTQYNCLAVLWDQRKTDFVQLYYVNMRESSRRSPIYSIQFDNTHLYCATDKHVIELNFSGRLYQKLDYKAMYIP
ncbi:F-box/WD repeat-containing protein 4 isoform X2 [Temnothorax americanus]|uniref:F-box/WD repeat-containing protein 4 isoform X2 n=1 Tax=Temnothorax americanus TaxID=1964332 RepID=UPI0040679D58